MVKAKSRVVKEFEGGKGKIEGSEGETRVVEEFEGGEGKIKGGEGEIEVLKAKLRML